VADRAATDPSSVWRHYAKAVAPAITACVDTPRARHSHPTQPALTLPQLGDVFIKNALTVFSYSHNGAPAVGFQQLVANAASNTTSVPVAVVTQTAGQPGATTGTLRQTRTSGSVFTFTAGGGGSAASSRSAGERGRIVWAPGSGLDLGLGLAVVGVIVGATFGW
jgi:hypothetical protein